MLCLLLGLVAAVGLLSSILLYADAAHNRLLQGELDPQGRGRGRAGWQSGGGPSPFSFLWRYIGAWNGNVTWDRYAPGRRLPGRAAPAVVDLLGTQVRHVARKR